MYVHVYVCNKKVAPINLVFWYDLLTHVNINNWWKKCAPAFPRPTFSFSPKCQIMVILADLSQYQPKNWLFGQNKPENIFCLNTAQNTHIEPIWPICDYWLHPRTLFNHWFSTIVQKSILTTFGTFSLHELSFFGKTIHPTQKIIIIKRA